MPVISLPSPGSLFLTIVDVTSDWTDDENAVADIEESTGWDLSSPEHDTYIYLWEGEFDPDDFSILQILANGQSDWEDIDGNDCDFVSPPVSELAYILSIQVIA